MWKLNIYCRKENEEDRHLSTEIDRVDVNFANLLRVKDQLGFGVRDYYFYLRRSGNDIACADEIENSKDVDRLIQEVESSGEKVVRLVVSKSPLGSDSVSITPLKRPRGTESDDDDDGNDDELVDEYKTWMQAQGPDCGMYICFSILHSFHFCIHLYYYIISHYSVGTCRAKR